MARVEDEINELLRKSGIEAGDAAVRARSTATGNTGDGAFEALAHIVVVQREAIQLLAREVDELRSAISGRDDR
jgi:hypothetical protein